jgi:hypothetical protein
MPELVAQMQEMVTENATKSKKHLVKFLAKIAQDGEPSMIHDQWIALYAFDPVGPHRPGVLPRFVCADLLFVVSERLQEFLNVVIYRLPETGETSFGIIDESLGFRNCTQMTPEQLITNYMP